MKSTFRRGATFLLAGALLIPALCCGAPASKPKPELSPEPLPVAAILDASRPVGPDAYALSTWDRIPGVLVFDFADTGSQAEVFRRIGFFLEVSDTAGRILPVEAYEGRHVYNAHDYRAADLARFFQAARDAAIALTPGEERLLALLKATGMLDAALEPVAEGPAALVSISRSFDAPTRARYLRHELLHAVYFALPRWALAVRGYWRALPPEGRALWTVFLANKGTLDGRPGFSGYDGANEDLLMNEMQAFSLQQNAEAAGEYFKYYMDLLARRVSEARPAIEAAFAKEPDFLAARAGELAERFSEVCGFSLDEAFAKGH